MSFEGRKDKKQKEKRRGPNKLVQAARGAIFGAGVLAGIATNKIVEKYHEPTTMADETETGSPKSRFAFTNANKAKKGIEDRRDESAIVEVFRQASDAIASKPVEADQTLEPLTTLGMEAGALHIEGAQERIRADIQRKEDAEFRRAISSRNHKQLSDVLKRLQEREAEINRRRQR